ncbi:hypothetical protein GCM10022243_28910 [Saccharothrix violaceirubra]|uniref:AcrR family transcriptional regulator n=1 Tax=Saccharothrix violaceirubra TaxID=413306 RepID=A0A7W7WZ45_9PSEU|nr:TetR/AcrR family transcriptional regulator [Saccharothrix violaceirubra]MBB4969184.1 AcrR family transcriptional regulator [Saccharothrix violaceirubra]
MVRQPPSRTRLLRAGRDALLSAGSRILAEGLTIEAIVERAHLTTTTFYNNWPNKDRFGLVGGKEKFLDDLLGTLADGTAYAPLVFPGGTGDPRRLVRDRALQDFRALCADPAARARLFLATFARGHTAALRSARVEYRELSRRTAQACEATLAEWGAVLRKPFGPDSLAVVLTALVEGLALRRVLDPASVPDDLFGDAAVALLGAVVDGGQRDEHVDDVIAPLAEEVSREFHPDRLPDDPEQAVVDAAAHEFAHRGYHGTRLAHIATTAGVDLPTIKRLFPTKADIVAAGLRPSYDEVRKRLSTDVRLERPAPEILVRHLERLALATTAHRAMFDALMVLSTQDDTAREHVPNFPALVTPVIEEGQHAGRFTTALPAAELAALLTDTVLVRSFRRRDHAPTEVTNAVTVLLSGVLNGSPHAPT